MVEAPDELQKSFTIPDDHLKVCNDLGIPTKGNAAGNTVNLLDLTGQTAPTSPLPAGFTARGIVALVFSILSALLGVIVIAWYGFSEQSPVVTGVASGSGLKE
ncbi:MAG: hypothetical protein M1816_002794 [Peltula sp. TS41687]|nr:MAG: hypothetical protein M1816_002794 [Peltula sp. TS41687]